MPRVAKPKAANAKRATEGELPADQAPAEAAASKVESMFPDESEPVASASAQPIQEFSPGTGQTPPEAESAPVAEVEKIAPKASPQKQPKQPRPQPQPPERTAPEVKGPPIAISTLQALSIAELNKMAREMNVENFGTMRKQEVVRRDQCGVFTRPLADQGEIRFVEAHHIHSRNERYMDYFPVFRATDIPASARDAARAEHEANLLHALGPTPDRQVAAAFGGMMGSSIHDVYALSGLLGRPVAISNAEVWDDGHCWRAMFEYPNGARVNYAWIDIRDVRRFQQEFIAYGPDVRVHLTMAMPFKIGRAHV